MLRSVMAVVGGFVTMAFVVTVSTMLAMRFFLPQADRARGSMAAGPLTKTYLSMNLTASGVAAIVGGYVTADIAGHDRLAHGLALGALMVIMSVLSMRQAGDAQPRWYQLVLATVMPLLALSGALLCDAMAAK